MAVTVTTVLSLLVAVTLCLEDLSFPPGFKFGASSSAYQIEGGWNASDKGESICDRFLHQKPEVLPDNGDIACDSYHKWQRDVEMLSELGVHFYRFSISWSRLLPTGFSNKISKDGKNYYNKLINGLLAKGIEPLVTLYHADLPQRLQDLGGWTNPLLSDWFADYARVAYSLYGDRVKFWLTINEPIMICEAAYNSGSVAPSLLMPESPPNICSKVALIAHAKAWRIYDKEFRSKHHGKVSISNYLMWLEPYSEIEKNITEIARENLVGRYSHPVFSKSGDWPQAVKKLMAQISKKQGYPKSYLPAFSKKEIAFVRGTYDFYALNYYTSRLIRKAKPGEKLGYWPLVDAPEINAKMVANTNWKQSVVFWFYAYPAGLRHQLTWLKKQYGDIELMITENGYPTTGGLDDEDRIKFFNETLYEILNAIKVDSIRVTGFATWSLMDSFEWLDGFKTKFGLYQVDFNSTDRTRTPRSSAHFYKKVIKNHSLQK